MRKVCIFTYPFPFMQAINNGIASCSRRVGPWRIEVQYFSDETTVVEFLKRRRYDGVIVTYGHPLVERAAATGVPVVHALATGQGVPSVVIDDLAIGKLAAQHLLECGYYRFAYFGSEAPWSLRRLEGFRSVIEAAGYPISAITHPGGEDPAIGTPQFLDSLRCPVGVLACNDATARHVTDQAIERGIRVPGDLAVLGVDDDTLVCETGACPLSSVDPDLHKVGYEAALLLDRLMRGEVSNMPVVAPVAPKGVTRRQSTSLLAHDDPDIAAALRLIYERACDGLTVEEVCRHVAMSRRQFELRFVKTVGRPPGVEIRNVRIDRAKWLLAETDMIMSEICIRCGYAYSSGFASAFRAVVGMSPGDFRRGQRGQ